MEINKPLVISQNKKVLENFIEVYKNLYFQGEYNGNIIFLKDFNIEENKDEMLSSLKENYNLTLKLLKGLGEDVSKYPNKLEEFTKQDEK
jgi:hypothetical protein